MADIVLRDIDKFFGDNHVIRKLNLEIRHKEFVVLLGQSGCGKTTTLRAIAGLEEIDAGEIRVDDVPVQDRRPGERDIAFVFQLFALYPHLTAYQNIAFPLRATRESGAEVRRRVQEVASALQIEHLLDRRPSALSGGDMQRVAIGRALVRRPKALLMDEPIGALDAKLRAEMRVELKRLHMENESTSIYVTHDQVEATSLADRIAVMHEGVLQQVGTPVEVYHRPANLFVAQFIGSPVMNVASATLSTEDDRTMVTFEGGAAPLPFAADLRRKLAAEGCDRADVLVGIRPENILVEHHEAPDSVPVEAHIIEPLGAYDIVDLKFGDKLMRARTSSGYVTAGSTVWARLDETSTHFFDVETERALRIEQDGGHG
ncbi:MAG: ABC transporter ATP-binding protein [Alphaproteobacteria bacterium]